MRRPIAPRWLIGALALAACSGRSNDAPSRAADTASTRAAATTDSAAASTPVSEWQIVPGHAGPINRETSEADLRQHYGGAVESRRIEIGEGETAAGAVLFPGDSIRRTEIVWQDSVNRRQPARLIIRGERTQWQLPRGITLGTNLQELERLNGRPFLLAASAGTMRA